MKVSRLLRRTCARNAMLKAGGGETREDLNKVCVAISQHFKTQGAEVSRQAIWEWWDRGRIPASRIASLAALAGIPPHEVDPAVFPPP